MPARSGSFDDAEIRYLTKRADDVTRHFASAMGIDDFMTRLEIALWQYGFQVGGRWGAGSGPHAGRLVGSEL